MPFLHQLDELALGKQGVREVEPGEFYLLGVINAQRVEHPVIQFAVVVKFQRAYGMRDALDGVGDAVGEVVHGVDAPLVSRTVMLGMPDAVQRGVTHDHIGRGHINFCAKHQLSVRKFPRLHAAEQVKAFLRRAIPPGAGGAGFGKRSAIFTDFFSRQFIHIGLALHDQFFGIGVQAVKIIGSVVRFAFPFKAHPAYILLDGVNILHVFFYRIGIVEAQIALAAKILGESEIQTDGFGMTDMQVAVGFGGEARVNPAVETAAFVVLCDARAQEVLPLGPFLRWCAGCFGLLTHELAPDPAAGRG